MEYGVSYYPEHEAEARWPEDVRLMAAAGFTTVRLAEFAWARLEPQPERFDFAWLDRVIACLAAEGLQVVLGTPTAAPPRWLVDQHPEICFVNAHGQTFAPESRRFVCLNSPAFRAASERIVRAMAQRYGQHPAVIAWQIDNEFGCHGTTRCHCPTCQASFRQWVRARYGDLAALNAAWGTGFWGRDYSAWSQVALPAPTPTYHSPGQILDAFRFASDSARQYQDLQLAILRMYAPGRPLFHNLMANFDEIDYRRLTEPLDFVAWDCYIPDGATWLDTARYHDQTYGFKHRPFWVAESPPGQVNWTTYNPDLRPGEARLRTLQAFAHGADGVFYFHWRAFRAGGEQYHSAILPHDGIPGRAYREAAELGTELAALAPLLAHSTPHPEVALLHDQASYWALQHQPHSALLRDPELYVRPWYNALRRRNVATTVVAPDTDLSRFRLVIAPALHLVEPEVAAALERYVVTGGTLVLGPRTGFKQPNNLVTDQPLPGLLAELAGIHVREWAALPPTETRTLQSTALGGALAGALWRELLEVRGAEPLAIYADGYDAGHIAVSVHHVGAGKVCYAGLLGDAVAEALTDYWLTTVLPEAVLPTPPGVELCLRQSTATRILFLLNHTVHNQQVPLPGQWSDARSGAPAGSTARLGPLEVQIFTQPLHVGAQPAWIANQRTTMTARTHE